MGAHIGTHTLSEGHLTGIVFQHPDDRLTLLIGDGVKDLRDLLDRIDRLNHRMCRGLSIEVKGCFLARFFLQPDLPVRMHPVGDAGLHPRGKALIEPDIIPPGHGDQIAEPLMRHLVGHGGIDVLAIGLIRTQGVEQKNPFEIENGPPIFHRTKAAAIGHSKIIELGQGVGRSEIVIKFNKDLGGIVQCNLALFQITALGHHPDLNIADLGDAPLQIAETEEQQIAAHLWGRGKPNLL